MTEEEKISLAKAVAERMLGKHGIHFRDQFIPIGEHLLEGGLQMRMTFHIEPMDDIYIGNIGVDSKGSWWQVQSTKSGLSGKEITIIKMK